MSDPADTLTPPDPRDLADTIAFAEHRWRSAIAFRASRVQDGA
jgi:hypothetical protein